MYIYAFIHVCIYITPDMPFLRHAHSLDHNTHFLYVAATAVVTVTNLKGFGLSSLYVRVQHPPTDSGRGVLSITPDDAPSHPVVVTITSSNTAQITCTSTITFPAGVVSTQNVTMTHISSGSIREPVILSFTSSSDAASNYFFVVIPSVRVVPLGTFVLSHTSVRVQKGRYFDVVVAPNIVPDQDVIVYVMVGNESFVTATPQLTFSARRMDSQVTS
jgi:hypothetical protein